MARDEDERQQVIREDRMRKGKAASTASARKEMEDQNSYVPKTQKRRDPRIVVARQAEMTKEEIVQEVMQIVGAGRPALTYQISRRRRGQRQGRQQS